MRLMPAWVSRFYFSICTSWSHKLDPLRSSRVQLLLFDDHSNSYAHSSLVGFELPLDRKGKPERKDEDHVSLRTICFR